MQRVDYEKLVVRDLLNLHESGELDISPWYQRRAVWTSPQKAFLINTLFESMPVPSLYIRHYLDIESEKSIKEVVDGQQRIRAIIEYYDDEFTARHPDVDKRIKYSSLSNAQKRHFLMTSLSVGYLIEASDADVIEIFGRLNSVSKNLNEQERRNARYSGEFKQFCLREAAERVTFWREVGIFTANDIARMVEIQFVSELVLTLIDGLQDYSARLIDKYYKEYESDLPNRDKIKYRLDTVFNLLADLDHETIRATIFRRPPIFFSLFVVLDSLQPKPKKTFLSGAMHHIDSVFNSDLPINERETKDAEFYAACTSSTQRIKSRTIRDEYLRTFLS